MLYKDAAEMIDYVSHAEAAKEAAVLLYSPGLDPFLEELARNTDRVWYFEEGPRDAPKLISRAHPKAGRSQITLEAFSLGESSPWAAASRA
jgi:23S rRNA A2030 N6-methylase RlmJ